MAPGTYQKHTCSKSNTHIGTMKFTRNIEHSSTIVPALLGRLSILSKLSNLHAYKASYKANQKKFTNKNYANFLYLTTRKSFLWCSITDRSQQYEVFASSCWLIKLLSSNIYVSIQENIVKLHLQTEFAKAYSKKNNWILGSNNYCREMWSHKMLLTVACWL